MSHKLVVSIINFRTPDLTIGCVQSVLADIGDHDIQVAIVDNASGDGSADTIAAWLADQPAGTPVRLVRSEVNSGFSGGHNTGMAALKGEYYLILNSDALLRPGFFTAILDAADANPQAGLIAPQIETEEGEVQVSCFRFHSPWSELIRGAGSGPVTRILSRHVVALPPPVDPAQIEWASFACIMVRAKAVEQIGPMDEGYFLYFEDAEYSLRARRAGWGVIQQTGAVAVHFGGGSGPVKTLQKARKRLPPYYYASRSRFFYQRGGWPGLMAANILWFSGRAIATLRGALGKKIPPRHDHELSDIWINALRPLGPRRAPGE